MPTAPALEALRIAGDVAGQRAYGWQVFARIATGFVDDGRVLQGWVEQAQLFDTTTDPAGRTGATHQSVGAPLILLTHYNPAAVRHIEAHRLGDRAALDRLRTSGAPDARIPGLRAVPEFPSDAIVVKTCWWPIAARSVTPMPYWDPRREAPRRGGNPYTSWHSVAAVEPPSAGGTAVKVRDVALQFAGRDFPRAPRVALDSLYHLRVDARLARRLMSDREARRAAAIALGRPLAAGDHLALVATHIATRELPEWAWITMWWDGVQAASAPQRAAPWDRYRLDATFDAELPRAADGGARVAFNPWLEARMPDGGAGDGTRSNCLACHRRATYPGTRFLPVTRGAPDLTLDPAFTAGKLHTGFLWSIATRSR